MEVLAHLLLPMSRRMQTARIDSFLFNAAGPESVKR